VEIRHFTSLLKDANAYINTGRWNKSIPLRGHVMWIGATISEVRGDMAYRVLLWVWWYGLDRTSYVFVSLYMLTTISASSEQKLICFTLAWVVDSPASKHASWTYEMILVFLMRIENKSSVQPFVSLASSSIWTPWQLQCLIIHGWNSYPLSPISSTPLVQTVVVTHKIDFYTNLHFSNEGPVVTV
jgi:hypothetical protein